MLAVPHVRQKTSWTCGPACAAMVSAFYNRPQSETDIADEVGCTSDNGVDPEPLVRFFRDRRHRLKTRYGMRFDDVAACLGKGWPIIVAYQDWSWRPRETNYHTCLDNGHYAVLIGIRHERIWLADPSSERPRRSLSIDDFLGRWRDVTAHGRIYHRWALAVGPRSKVMRG